MTLATRVRCYHLEKLAIQSELTVTCMNAPRCSAQVPIAASRAHAMQCPYNRWPCPHVNGEFGITCYWDGTSDALLAHLCKEHKLQKHNSYHEGTEFFGELLETLFDADANKRVLHQLSPVKQLNAWFGPALAATPGVTARYCCVYETDALAALIYFLFYLPAWNDAAPVQVAHVENFGILIRGDPAAAAKLQLELTAVDHARANVRVGRVFQHVQWLGTGWRRAAIERLHEPHPNPSNPGRHPGFLVLPTRIETGTLRIVVHATSRPPPVLKRAADAPPADEPLPKRADNAST
jgi:hypothetical protein